MSYFPIVPFSLIIVVAILRTFFGARIKKALDEMKSEDKFSYMLLLFALHGAMLSAFIQGEYIVAAWEAGFAFWGEDGSYDGIIPPIATGWTYLFTYIWIVFLVFWLLAVMVFNNSYKRHQWNIPVIFSCMGCHVSAILAIAILSSERSIHYLPH